MRWKRNGACFACLRLQGLDLMIVSLSVMSQASESIDCHQVDFLGGWTAIFTFTQTISVIQVRDIQARNRPEHQLRYEVYQFIQIVDQCHYENCEFRISHHS